MARPPSRIFDTATRGRTSPGGDGTFWNKIYAEDHLTLQRHCWVPLWPRPRIFTNNKFGGQCTVSSHFRQKWRAKRKLRKQNLRRLRHSWMRQVFGKKSSSSQFVSGNGARDTEGGGTHGVFVWGKIHGNSAQFDNPRSFCLQGPFEFEILGVFCKNCLKILNWIFNSWKSRIWWIISPRNRASR